MGKKIDVGGELNSTALDKKLVDAAQVKDGSRREKTLVKTNEEIEYLLVQEEERQKQFEANEAARQAEADKTEQDRADEAARTEAERQATFEANEAERQVLYEKVAKNTDGIELLNTNTGVSEYPTFDEAKAYAVGDVVLYEGLLKRFTSAHEAGAWDGSQVEDWSERKEVDGKIGELELKIDVISKDEIKSINSISNSYKKVLNKIQGVSIRSTGFITDPTQATYYCYVAKDIELQISSIITGDYIRYAYCDAKPKVGISCEYLEGTSKFENLETITPTKNRWLAISVATDKLVALEVSCINKSIGAEVNKINNEIESILKDVEEINDRSADNEYNINMLIEKTPFVIKGLREADGVTINESYFGDENATTPIIPLSLVRGYKQYGIHIPDGFRCNRGLTTCPPVMFYDSSKKLLSVINTADVIRNILANDIPHDAIYFSLNKSELGGAIQGFGITDTNEKIVEINNSIKDYSYNITENTIDINGIFNNILFTCGYYIGSNGRVNHGGCAISGLINVSRFGNHNPKVIKISDGVLRQVSDIPYSVLFFNNEKKFVSGLAVDRIAAGYIIDIPEGVNYVEFVGYRDNYIRIEGYGFDLHDKYNVTLENKLYGKEWTTSETLKYTIDDNGAFNIEEFGSSANNIYTTIPNAIGDVIYLGLQMQSKDVHRHLRARLSSGANQYIYYQNSGEKEWVSGSIVSAGENTLLSVLEITGSSMPVVGNITLSNIVVVNLTECFGKGKEPSVEIMDYFFQNNYLFNKLSFPTIEDLYRDINEVKAVIGNNLESADKVLDSTMDIVSFINAYNSKLEDYASLCKCNINCFTTLPSISTPTDIKMTWDGICRIINNNHRETVITPNMSFSTICNRVNNALMKPVNLFVDAKINKGGIDWSFDAQLQGDEPSVVVTNEGKMQLFAHLKRWETTDGVNWSDPITTVLIGGADYIMHNHVSYIKGNYYLIGCDQNTGGPLRLYKSADGIQFTYVGIIFQEGLRVNETIEVQNWGNTCLMYEDNKWVLMYEMQATGRGWEICMATCSNLEEVNSDGTVGDWTQSNQNPVLAFDNSSYWNTAGNPDIAKGMDNRPIKVNGKYYLYYHSQYKNGGSGIKRAYSYDLEKWEHEGWIYDNRDIPTGGIDKPGNADHCIIEYKGRTYLFYTWDINDSNATPYIRYAIDDRPLHELLRLLP